MPQVVCEAESDLEIALNLNRDFVNDMDENEEKFSSFLNSASVGITTLEIMYIISSRKDDKVNWDHILNLLKKNFIPVKLRCNDEKELVHGSAGFLHALLLLNQVIKKGEALKCLHDIIRQTVK
jgi:hypothetical protein